MHKHILTQVDTCSYTEHTVDHHKVANSAGEIRIHAYKQIPDLHVTWVYMTVCELWMIKVAHPVF